jgi:tetratricopeptide (TPR) repeat protein
VHEDHDRGVFELIVRFCREGLEQAAAGKYDEAVASYFAAWELLPEPREEWDAAPWILAAIGDVLYRRKGYTMALDFFQRARRCPGGAHNPFVHMRLGQIHLHLGDHERAREALALALEVGGRKVFRGEDPRWLDWLGRTPIAATA